MDKQPGEREAFEAEMQRRTLHKPVRTRPTDRIASMDGYENQHVDRQWGWWQVAWKAARQHQSGEAGADATRYRWLRGQFVSWDCASSNKEWRQLDALDAAVDAALRSQPATEGGEL